MVSLRLQCARLRERWSDAEPKRKSIIADAVTAMDAAHEAVQVGLYDVALLTIGHHHAKLSRLLDDAAPAKTPTTASSQPPQS